MSSFIDLHLHCIAGVDDGVRTVEEGIELCKGLYALGFTKVVATPHIRTAMFENQPADLRAAYENFREIFAGEADFPVVELGAEYYYDERFWEVFQSREALLLPGGKSVLVEFPVEGIPRGIEQRFFRMMVRGVRPVLAHPERYFPLARSTEPVERALQTGAVGLLDITALDGKYGRSPQRAAERMLDEGVYYAASTDAHSPTDVEVIERSIKRLNSLVGKAQVNSLLSEHPANILGGTVGDNR